MMGPGRYDEVCTTVRQVTGAETCVVLIINGNNGSGFSVQTQNPARLERLPAVLREMAAQLERGQKGVIG